MFEFETKIELLGDLCPVIVGYEPDEGKGANGILIGSVILRRCIKERGDMSYDKHGDAYRVTFPEYVSVELFPVLNGKQISALVEEISGHLEEMTWDQVMNEPRYSLPRNFPDNFPGVRL